MPFRVAGNCGGPMTAAALGEDLPERDDADLVAQITAGNIDEPVAELYRRYGPRLYRFGVQLLGDSGLAEEMVQECFVRLWRTAGRFDINRGTVAGYLSVIAGASPLTCISARPPVRWPRWRRGGCRRSPMTRTGS